MILIHDCMFLHPDHARLSHLLPVHVDAVARCSDVARRQPVLGILVVERPRRDDDEEGQRGACEANVERQPDVLLREADEEGDDLEG